MATTRSTRGASGWPVRFVVLVAIWGFSFLFIKIGDRSLAPLQVAFGRMICGTALLLILLVIRREPLPRGWRVWGQLAVAGLLLNAAPFALFAYGEQHVSSVLAGIWNATTPLMVAPIAMLWLPAERATWQRILGLLAGFVGVLIVLGVWSGFSSTDIAGNVMCLGAAACYGLGIPFTRRYLAGRNEGLVALAAGQLICGTVEVGIAAVMLTHRPLMVPAMAIASIAALGALGTGIAYILSYSIMRDAGAIAASLVTYFVPVVSTLAGVLLLGEHLTWNEPVGGLVILLGSLFSQDQVRNRLLKRPSTSPVRTG